MRTLFIITCLLLFPVLSLAEEAKASDNPKVLMKTSLGDVTIELYQDKAPITVKNFLSYVDKKGYDGTIFHRVISNFMIQGGGFTPELKKVPTDAAIKNEADNGLSNEVGTIAMARTNVVDSATNQFFINVAPNKFLNHKGPGPQFGYAVFGKVTKGMEVVDKIKMVSTKREGMHANVPVEPVLIKTIQRL